MLLSNVLMLRLGLEYIQLTIVIVIKAFSTLMAPVGMNQLLQYAFSLIPLWIVLTGRLPVTLKPKGKALSSVHGFGSHFFFWALLSEPLLNSGTISSRSVIEDICNNSEFLMCGPWP